LGELYYKEWRASDEKAWRASDEKAWNKYCNPDKIENKEKAETLADLFTENEYLRLALKYSGKLDQEKSRRKKGKYQKKIEECKTVSFPKTQKDKCAI
jgi:hypothetical protein